MPNAPVKHGKGYRVKWKLNGTNDWQGKTVSFMETDKLNKDAAWALYVWLKERGDTVPDTDPAIRQNAFLRPNQPLYEAATGPTFAFVAEEMISLKVHTSAVHRENERAKVRNHFAEWSELPIKSITPPMVAARATAMQEYASAWSYSKYMVFARSVFKYALREGYLTKNPAEAIVVREPEQKPMKIMTPEHFEILHSAGVGVQVRDIMHFMVQTGCRIGEVHALRVADLRLDDPTPFVFIHRTTTRGYSGVKSEGPPKSRKNRVITLDPVTVRLLRELTADSKNGEDYVFPAPGGGAWHYTSWRPNQWMPTMLKAAELGFPANMLDLTSHGLRHTHASWLLAAGVDIRVLSERLGHSDPAFTLKKYIHATVRGDTRLREVLGEQSAWLPRTRGMET